MEKVSRSDLEFKKFLLDYVKEKLEKPALGRKFRLVKKRDIGRVQNQPVLSHIPQVVGVAMSYHIGSKVKTNQGKIGKVLGNIWLENLVLFEKGIPYAGHFAVKVDFGDETKYFLRDDLIGKFPNGCE